MKMWKPNEINRDVTSTYIEGSDWIEEEMRQACDLRWNSPGIPKP